jgi:sulfur carrier protein ThiS
MITINEKEYEFCPGLTLDKTFKKYGIVIEGANIVIVNGRVLSRTDLGHQLAQDKMKMTILKLIGGG